MHTKNALSPIRVEGYKGSLPRLLELVRNSDIATADISILEIITQYRAEHVAQGSPPSTLLFFCYCVAELLYLKAARIVGSEVEELSEEESEYRAFITDMLIEYQRYRKLATLLVECYDRLGDVLEREAFFPRPERKKLDDPLALKASFLALQQRLQKPGYAVAVFPHLELKQARDLIEERLPSSIASVFFSDICKDHEDSEDKAVLYTTILQMAREERCTLRQDRSWGEIRIERRLHERVG